MNMNINLSLSLASIKKVTIAFLHRFHIMIFVIIVLNGSIGVILLLNGNIITSGGATDYTPASNNTTFDDATIKRVKELRTPDQSGSDLDLSAGRTNPFVE